MSPSPSPMSSVVAEAISRPAARVRTKPAFYIALSAFMVGVMLVGFWPTYFGRLLSPMLIGMAYDWRTRGRPRAAYVVATAWLFVGGTRVLLVESETWLRIGRVVLDVFV